MNKEITPAVKKDMTVGYEDMRLQAARMSTFTRIKLDVDVALKLADMSPYPAGVRLGVMKQVANNELGISLHQMRIILGWAADRAQR